LPAEQLLQLIALLLDRLQLLFELPALVVDLDEAVDVGLDVAVATVGFDLVQVLADEGDVQHDPLKKDGTAKTLREDKKVTITKRRTRAVSRFPTHPLLYTLYSLLILASLASWRFAILGPLLQRHVGDVVLADVDLLRAEDAVVFELLQPV